MRKLRPRETNLLKLIELGIRRIGALSQLWMPLEPMLNYDVTLLESTKSG